MASLELLKIRLNSIKSTLDKANEKEKKGNVSMHFASNFNSIIDEISIACPELNCSMPNKLERDSTFHMLNVANINYFDLDIYCETMLHLLEYAERKQSK